MGGTFAGCCRALFPFEHQESCVQSEECAGLCWSESIVGHRPCHVGAFLARLLRRETERQQNDS
jgi:hypothetical protein